MSGRSEKARGYPDINLRRPPNGAGNSFQGVCTMTKKVVPPQAQNSIAGRPAAPMPTCPSCGRKTTRIGFACRRCVQAAERAAKTAAAAAEAAKGEEN